MKNIIHDNRKAPDKIYVHEISAEELTENFPYHVCYIRRDALIDWIKDQLKENAEWREVNPDDRFFGGKEVAFNYTIDKIESL